MEAKVYDKQGKEKGKVKLPESIFGVFVNADLLHQVVRIMELNARTPVAHTKDRSEIRGTGKKPWRQKGTGRARHGSRRSPIWRTGGVAHGPRNEKKYGGKINKKMKAKALYVSLTEKFKNGEVIFIENLSFDKPSTKDAKEFFNNLGKIKGIEDVSNRKSNRAMISLDTKNKETELSFKNFGNVGVKETRSLNPVDVLKYKYLIIVNPKESIKFLESRLPLKEKRVEKDSKKVLKKRKTTKTKVKK